MMYLILLACFFAMMLVYFRIADHFNIIDRPNHRSSHIAPTIRGGGVIFWFASLLYFVQHFNDSYWLFISVSIISIVSFWDDISSLPNKIRVAAHFLAITIIFSELGVFNLLPAWFIAVAYVVCIGIINAYNFMDGINGITGSYTLVILCALLYVNQSIIHVVERDLIIYPILACLVFLFFNFRKKAKCFAGDVGSIAIALWLIYLIIRLMIGTGSFIWILFLAVYGVDAISTIIHRIFLRQNIFEAHRLHFYQVLCNEYKIPHRLVSFLYAITQLLICAFVILCFNQLTPLQIWVAVLIPLLMVYSTKFYLLKNKNS